MDSWAGTASLRFMQIQHYTFADVRKNPYLCNDTLFL